MVPILKHIEEHKQDAVLWQAAEWIRSANGDAFHLGTASEKIAKLLAYIPNDVTRERYVVQISKDHKLTKKSLLGYVQDARAEYFDEEDDDAGYKKKSTLPEWVEDKEAVYINGYTQREDKGHTGYYFLSDSDKLVQRTGFIFTPLYHILSQNAEMNRRIGEVTNGYTSDIVELSSKNLLSTEAFKGTLSSAGHYLPKPGFTNDHLVRLMNNFHFKPAFELLQLGWQGEEGFFAFSNMVYRPPAGTDQSGILGEYNEYGVAEVDNKNYLSPSNSKSNKNIRSSENIYENDLYLQYKKSPIDFEEWCTLMLEVYGQNALFAIPFVITTLFRDLVIKVTKIPHLYAYGPVGAGKSEYGESISNLFFSGTNSQGELYKPFNLNQGTDYAFWNGMERFVNCPYALNEFDENAIEDSRFRAIKSAYDSEGRAKGMKEKNRATMQKVVCTLVLMGQYLGTKDDNAVLMRTLPLSFKREDSRPEEQIRSFNRLKDYERKGMSSILVELMNMRWKFKKQFPDVFDKCRKELQEELLKLGVQSPVRIIKNIACMIAAFELAAANFRLPVTTEQFKIYAVEFTRRMTILISSTSGISSFWQMVEYLLDRKMIEEGKDFELKEESSVTIHTDDGGKEEKELGLRTVLYLRMSGVHKLYMQIERQTTGKPGINQQTLLLYMKDQPYYLGWVKTRRWKLISPNSCYAYDYEQLGINLVRDKPDDLLKVVVEGEAIGDVEPTTIPGMLVFSLMELRPAKDETTPTNKRVYKCYINDQSAYGSIVRGYKVQVAGMLKVTEHGNRTWYQIDVLDFEAVSKISTFERNLSVDNPADRVKDDLPL